MVEYMWDTSGVGVSDDSGLMGISQMPRVGDRLQKKLMVRCSGDSETGDSKTIRQFALDDISEHKPLWLGKTLPKAAYFDSDDIQKGIILKRAGPFNSVYKKRFFCLKGAMLYYFRCEEDSRDPEACLGAINIKMAEFVGPGDRADGRKIRRPRLNKLLRNNRAKSTRLKRGRRVVGAPLHAVTTAANLLTEAKSIRFDSMGDASPSAALKQLGLRLGEKARSRARAVSASTREFSRRLRRSSRSRGNNSPREAPKLGYFFTQPKGQEEDT